MADLTPNLGIKKPLATENVTRASFNENWDIIDQKAAPKEKAQMFKLTQDTGIRKETLGADLTVLQPGQYYATGNYIKPAPPFIDGDYDRDVYHIDVSKDNIETGSTTFNIRRIWDNREWIGTYYNAKYTWHEVITDRAPIYFNLTLQNGITVANYSGVARTPRYIKIGKQVFIEGEINAVSGVNITIATLPVGVRPPATRLFKTAMNNSVSNDGATIYIENTTGEIKLQVAAGSSNTISLCGISFFVD
ncbi:hypothetical protein [Neobacillus mesonae]|uniref:Uncharacterized protein n=1 Tax=Neobacillus mesonae TaxID=1193713 RepID=A0A3T0HV93_9BACI|nr:hypothetical protein [Neobacillus mesonae]AZU61084.1 hypothetical protein CHR53_07355 [Neobacillus mesonae]